MGDRDYLKISDWNAICDVCGFKYKASELRKRWDNLMVCEKDFEHRHPQDFLRAVPDKQDVAWVRPDNDLDSNGQPLVDMQPTYIAASVGVQERTIPPGTPGNGSTL